MKVITENDITIIKDGVPMKQYWSEMAGYHGSHTVATRKVVSGNSHARPPHFDGYSNAGGKLFAKAKGLVGSGKISGVVNALKGSNNSGPAPINMTPPPAPVKKGLSKGAKIGIGVGAALLLGGLIWYFVKHKKKK